jgi:hypothetical protein
MIPDLAYIDAGSGSLIIQAVIATIIAVPLFFRTQIARFLRVVRGRDAEQGSVPADDGPREG